MRQGITALVILLAVLGVTAVTLRRQSAERPLPASHVLENVYGKAQARNLSCESRSASDLAAFWGLDVPELEFLSRLPTSDNPHFGFVGSPDDKWGQLPPNGYGVYAEPVADLLRQYGLPAEAVVGVDLDWLRRQLVEGRPVIIWATYQFKPRPVQTLSDSQGNTFKAVPFEHTYLVTGYSPDGFWVIDALDGQRKFITTAAFEAGWNLLDHMAVVAFDPQAVARGPSWQTVAESYGVPMLALIFLALGVITWRWPVLLRPGVLMRQPRRRPAMRQLQSAVADALSGAGRRSGREPRWTYAKNLGGFGLVIGLLLAIQLTGFNPFLGIPLVVGCGAIGFVLGYQIENWGR